MNYKNDLAEVFSAPMVFPPGGWGNNVPQRIKDRVIWERLELDIRGKWDRATDSEVVCYLFPASLTAPLSSDWTDIYLWITAQVLQLEGLLDGPTELTEWQKSQLDELRFKIRNSQIKNRKKQKGVIMETTLKVLLEVREGDVLVGTMKQGCDPRLEQVTGDLTAALAAVPGIVEAAEEHWKDHPRNPAAAKVKVESKPAPAPKAQDLPLLAQEESTAADVPEKKAPTAADVPEKKAPTTAADAEKKAPTTAADSVVVEGKYRLKDGRGPYATIQEALDGLGIPKDKRPNHNRYSRLSKELQETILEI